jgi:hypothetical protein
MPPRMPKPKSSSFPHRLALDALFVALAFSSACAGPLSLGSLQGGWRAVEGPNDKTSIQAGVSLLLVQAETLLVFNAPEVWIRSRLRCAEGGEESLECDAEDGVGSRLRVARKGDQIVIELTSGGQRMPYGTWERLDDPAHEERLSHLPLDSVVCGQTLRCQDQVLASLGESSGLRPVTLEKSQAAGCFAVRRHYAGLLLKAGQTVPPDCQPPPGAPPLAPAS